MYNRSMSYMAYVKIDMMHRQLDSGFVENKSHLHGHDAFSDQTLHMGSYIRIDMDDHEGNGDWKE